MRTDPRPPIRAVTRFGSIRRRRHAFAAIVAATTLLCCAPAVADQINGRMTCGERVEPFRDGSNRDQGAEWQLSFARVNSNTGHTERSGRYGNGDPRGTKWRETYTLRVLPDQRVELVGVGSSDKGNAWSLDLKGKLDATGAAGELTGQVRTPSPQSATVRNCRFAFGVERDQASDPRVATRTAPPASELDADRAKLAAEQARLSREQARLESERRAVESDKGRAATEIRKLDEQRRALDAEKAKLAAERRQLEQRERALTEQAAKPPTQVAQDAAAPERPEPSKQAAGDDSGAPKKGGVGESAGVPRASGDAEAKKAVRKSPMEL